MIRLIIRCDEREKADIMFKWLTDATQHIYHDMHYGSVKIVDANIYYDIGSSNTPVFYISVDGDEVLKANKQFFEEEDASNLKKFSLFAAGVSADTLANECKRLNSLTINMPPAIDAVETPSYLANAQSSEVKEQQKQFRKDIAANVYKY